MATKRVLFQYSEESMQSALRAIREENMAVSTACKTFKVPRTSVRNRLSGKTSDDCRRVGPVSCLGSEIEKKLVDFILQAASNGFPITREALFYSVQKLIEEFNIQTPFINNIPGRKWFEAFLKRNPVVSEKHAEYINKGRAAVSEERIRAWFEEVRQLLGPDIEILSDPSRLFNMDETAMFLSPKGNVVLGPKGRGVYDVTSTSEKDNVTTLMVVNANGELAPCLTLFKFQRLPKAYLQAAPNNWEIGISETGWMQSKQFYEYFANIFLKFLKDHNIQRPVVVFMDGHASHLSLHLSIFCRENGIILVCLPANTTHILQPLDVAFFFPLKSAWKKMTKKWQLENGGRTIQKKDVPKALSSIIKNKDFSASIKSGFRTCGLYPFDENSPDYNKCVTRPIPNDQEGVIEEENEDERNLKIFENQIEANILYEFENTFNTSLNWNGEERYLELYKVWKSLKEKVVNWFQNAFLNETRENNKDEGENNDRIIFNFPEFNYPTSEINVDNRANKVNVFSDITIKSSTDALILLEEEVQKTIDLFAKDDAKFNIDDDNWEEWDKNFDIDNSTDNHRQTQNNQDSSKKVTCEEISNSKENKKKGENLKSLTNDKENFTEDIRVFKKRSVSEVLKDLAVYPEQKPQDSSVRKKKRNLPAVVTHDKWHELMEAKQKTKSIKTERKIAKSKVKGDLIKERQRKEHSKAEIKKETINNRKDLENLSETTTALRIGTYVILKYDGEHYPAKICQIQNGEYFCCAMTKSAENWKWPDKNDLLWYKLEDIVMGIDEPKQINSRGVFVVPELKELIH